jgi:uncharacterized membrane protein
MKCIWLPHPREPDASTRAWCGMIAARTVFAGCAALLLVACQQHDAERAAPSGPTADAALPDADSTQAYNGIREDETVHFTGTEPFWGGEVAGATLTYTTPENPDGAKVAVERFAGRGGLSFGGSLAGADLEMTITPLECSDGMSERTYPFTVTLKVGDDLRNGCGWTERQPFAGPAQP